MTMKRSAGRVPNTPSNLHIQTFATENMCNRSFAHRARSTSWTTMRNAGSASVSDIPQCVRFQLVELSRSLLFRARSTSWTTMRRRRVRAAPLPAATMMTRCMPMAWTRRRVRHLSNCHTEQLFYSASMAWGAMPAPPACKLARGRTCQP